MVTTPISRNQSSGHTGSTATTLRGDSPAPLAPPREQARRALGDFLRRMRDRAAPPSGVRRGTRRAPGLRREEVALATGISVTWYTWLEQGRALRTSAHTLDALARALDLDVVERAHLRQLADAAGRAATSDGRTGAAAEGEAGLTTVAPPALRAMVDALAPHAAYVINGRWDVLHANAAAVALLGDFFATPGVTDNVLRRLFLDADWRARFEAWEVVAASAVAQFRAAAGHRLAEPAIGAFVDSLAAECATFGAWWDRYELAPPPIWEKVIHHPTAGRLRLRYASLVPDGAPTDLSVVLYVPADDAAMSEA